MIEYEHKSKYPALTVKPDYIGKNDSGWTITGEIHEDWLTWVNDFVADHPNYGAIYGDFEKIVYAESQEALDHFLEHHPIDEWDYHDI